LSPNTSLIREYTLSELLCDLSDLLRDLRDPLFVVIIDDSKDLGDFEEESLRGEMCRQPCPFDPIQDPAIEIETSVLR